MNIKTITILASIILLVSGCEIAKDEMSQKPYIAIVENISESGCGKLDTALNIASCGTASCIVGVDHLYTEQNVTCATYDKDEDHCKKATLFDIDLLDNEEDTDSRGSGTCVLGADINILNFLF